MREESLPNDRETSRADVEVGLGAIHAVGAASRFLECSAETACTPRDAQQSTASYRKGGSEVFFTSEENPEYG